MLAGGDGPLGLVEVQADAAVLQRRQQAGLLGMAVANLGRAADRSRRRRPGDPVEVLRPRRPREERAAGAQGDGVGRGVQPYHVVGLGKGQAQAPALAHGVVDQPPVAAQDGPVRAHKVAGLRPQAGPLLDHPGVVPVGNEADVLAVGLSGIPRSMSDLAISRALTPVSFLNSLKSSTNSCMQMRS